MEGWWQTCHAEQRHEGKTGKAMESRMSRKILSEKRFMDLRNSTGNTEENPTSGGIKRGFLEYFGCVQSGFVGNSWDTYLSDQFEVFPLYYDSVFRWQEFPYFKWYPNTKEILNNICLHSKIDCPKYLWFELWNTFAKFLCWYPFFRGVVGSWPWILKLGCLFPKTHLKLHLFEVKAQALAFKAKKMVVA